MIEFYRHQYRGLKYRPNVMVKKDFRKIDHLILDSNNKIIGKADFTPYCFMSKVDFQNYVDLGCPKRSTEMSNPFSSDSLRKKINKGKSS